MFTLAKKQQIGNYTIMFPVKEGDYAETYRVKDSAGKNRFLKLISYAKLHRTQFDSEGNVLEVEIAKQLDHPILSSIEIVEKPSSMVANSLISFLII